MKVSALIAGSYDKPGRSAPASRQAGSRFHAPIPPGDSAISPQSVMNNEG